MLKPVQRATRFAQRDVQIMSANQRQAKGMSLHIGVNKVDAGHYGGDAALTACENDARDMAMIALEQGYSARMLLTENATRDNVKSAMQDAANALKSGDIFFISFAGHGTQIPDTNGDEDDSLDETWCLYDGMLIDDEIKGLWASFDKGVRVIFISDSCHSGTASRGDPFAPPDPNADNYRMIAYSRSLQVYQQNQAFYDSILDGLPNENDLEIDCTILLVSAVQDDQQALDGVLNGLFTAKLKNIWDNGNFTQDYAAFHQALHDSLPIDRVPNYMVYPQPNPDFENQTPFKI